MPIAKSPQSLIYQGIADFYLICHKCIVSDSARGWMKRIRKIPWVWVYILYRIQATKSIHKSQIYISRFKSNLPMLEPNSVLSNTKKEILNIFENHPHRISFFSLSRSSIRICFWTTSIIFKYAGALYVIFRDLGGA